MISRRPSIRFQYILQWALVVILLACAVQPASASETALSEESGSDASGAAWATSSSFVVDLTARAGHTAVWTGEEMLVWGGTYNGSFPIDTGWRYNPETKTWRPISNVNAPEARRNHTAVWTGEEMIVWGGTVGNFLKTGGRYNPETDTWTPISTVSAPEGRADHTAIWTGDRMIVWGGQYSFGKLDDGGIYDPETDTWETMKTVDAPDRRSYHTAVWTGFEMIIWGGDGDGGQKNSGGRYNPENDTWSPLATADAPDARAGHSAVWTGEEMLVWGGIYSGSILNTGGRYNPARNSWEPIETEGAPENIVQPSCVWTGEEMLVWGGVFGSLTLSDGGRYNPETGKWTALNIDDAPIPRFYQSTVWTGTEMIVWGGANTDGTTTATFLNDGASYNPATDNWTEIPAKTTENLYGLTMVWSGEELLIWGGANSNFQILNTGKRYNPATDTWTSISTLGAPEARGAHTAVWTGTKMIIWGGSYPGPGTTTVYNTGGIYDPATDTWTPTSAPGALDGRSSHTAVWTGTEMLIWGGITYTDGGINTKLNTGWSYNPATDTWSEIPTLGAPEARVGHTALWTGEEMLIWGGRDQNDDNLNTGGRYNPLTKTWQPIDPAAFVDERTNHTAVWTGTEMIVWGGISNSHVDLSTGGRYNPKTNTWTATTQTGAPEGRSGHVAVWTGQEMLVWGGGYEDSGAGYGQVYLNNGAGYDPVKDAWTAMPTQAAPRARVLASAVWTGKEMLIWGGMAGMYMISSGGRYGYYADLEVSLSASPDPVKTGKEITYTIQLKNNGPAQAFDAMLEAPLPPHTSFVSAAATNGSGWAVEAPAPGGKGVVKFTKAAMANGESAQFQIVLKVERSAAEAKTLSLTVSASNDCVDLVSLDNSASVSTSVTLGEIPIFLPFLSKK